VTDDAMARRDQQITAIAAEFPGCGARQGLDGQRCQFADAVPHVGANAWSAGDRCCQVLRQEP
jgi:hypothetical protein